MVNLWTGVAKSPSPSISSAGSGSTRCDPRFSVSTEMTSRSSRAPKGIPMRTAFLGSDGSPTSPVWPYYLLDGEVIGGEFYQYLVVPGVEYARLVH